ESSDYAEAEEFYESMLADADDAGELLDSVLADGQGSTLIDLDIDKDLLKSFIEKHNVSENVLFSSVFAYTLSRFVGSEKILFNIVENGRDRFNNFDSVGMFVNTLPLLVNCKNQDIDSFMEHVSRMVYGVIRYNYYPFRLLAKKYGIKSDILFQFLPEWVMKTDSDEITNNVDKNDLLDNMGDLIADLSVEIIQRDDDYLLNVVYCDKYSSDFINRFVESYKLILKDMLRVKALKDICYVSSDDLVLLDELNETEDDLLYDDVLDAFNDNLVKYPDNILVSYEDRSYTYGESAFIANRIALSLKELNIEKQDKVAFLVERSELYMFCVLGILSVGCVHVPLDDDLPDERIRFILEDSGSHVVIVSDGTYECAQNLFNGQIILLNISDILKEYIETLNRLPVVYGDLACILYTSGTTGIPKGVKIRRKGINNFIDYYVNKYDMHNDSTFGLFSSIGFDVGAIRSICAPIYVGASLDIIPNDIRLNIDKLNKHFIDKGVTHTTLPTQVARMFINEIESTSLKVLNTGGEKLGDIVYATDYSFIDSYGPTECCVSVCDIEVKDKIDSSSIGHLFTNTKGYILDNENRRVPIGAVGELCIAGKQTADGYLNRPKETAASFVKNPFDSNEEYGVMYRTGDLVRILEDGTFAIVGRRDSQVKIRGNRVELGEVESVIRNIDLVENVTFKLWIIMVIMS
ncbi:MAG: amino acid adenylation domain-containing protein, partial [Methanobrevibacter sp.]|nr:amino acid adenylation domain-containing protein [Methanobrevibacter sp.]